MHETIEKLSQMKLHAMATAFKEQLDQPSLSGLSFEDRFAMLVDQEWTSREDRKLTRRLKAARLKTHATVEEIDYQHPRGMDKSVIRSLASCQWIRSHQNVIATGPTGIGKTYLAEAFVNKACREGFTAVRYRATRLFGELDIARGNGSYFNLLGRLAKFDLLAVDDWAADPLTEQERRHFMELMEDRHGLKSTFITSQYPVAKWHDRIGEPTMADAILDRIVHNAHKITLKGESMRKTKANLTDRDHQK
ncbi:MAG: IS21-like element helper ATPase IstB [Nitrospiraceae bacterium]|nr:IS21-like element helper ATPase IstB [Nitrospiraceae bacterium]